MLSILTVGINDLETKCPDLLKYWDYNNNVLKPYEVSYGSHTHPHAHSTNHTP